MEHWVIAGLAFAELVYARYVLYRLIETWKATWFDVATLLMLLGVSVFAMGLTIYQVRLAVLG